MRMKYYLRGMGIGIMGTVIIFMIALIFYKPNLSDAEVMKRAGELGMVMGEGSGTVADAQNGDNADEGEVINFGDDDSDGVADSAVDSTVGTATSSTSTDKPSSATTTDPSPSSNADTGDSASAGSTGSDAATTGGNGSTGTSTSTKTTTLNIAGGDSSETVSQKLYNADLVRDADEFNSYLVEHGYDRTLQNGEFSIPDGASYEDISQIITHKD